MCRHCKIIIMQTSPCRILWFSKKINYFSIHILYCFRYIITLILLSLTANKIYKLNWNLFLMKLVRWICAVSIPRWLNACHFIRLIDLKCEKNVLNSHAHKWYQKGMMRRPFKQIEFFAVGIFWFYYNFYMTIEKFRMWTWNGSR